MADDQFHLERFVSAQAPTYDQALAEVRAGRKQSHWMWYVFPQLKGLGASDMARHYGIGSVAEAEAYLRHPVLGARLVECMEAALRNRARSAREIFGTPDDMKLRSCATLFAVVSPAGSVFERVLETFFNGERDHRTLALLDARADHPVPDS